MITTDKILKKETTDWKIQLFRYVIVGGISFIVDYSLLFVLTEHVGLHYIVSATISFIAGLIVNYTISTSCTSWIFRNSKLSNTTVELIIYGAIGVVGLVLNNILLYLFTDILHIHYMLSKLITAALVMGWNFVGRRIILFNN